MAETPTMGLAVPLTGSLGEIGTSVVHGAEIAAADASGVSLRIEDTGGVPKRAVEVVEGFVEAGLPVVGGPISSDVALAVREVAEARGVPLLPAMGGNPALTAPGTRFTFRFSSSNRQSGLGTVEFFRERGAARIAIVGADFSYPHAVTEAIREFGADRGVDVDVAEFVPLGTEDFGAAVDAIGGEAVDGVFLPYPGAEAVGLLREIRGREALARATVLGDYSFGSAPYSRRLGDRLLGTFNWGVDTGSPRASALRERVRAQFGEATGVYHHFGHDVVGVAAAAIERVEPPTPEAVRDALRRVEYEAVSGWGVSFDADGLNERYEMLVNEWVEADGGPANRVAFRSGPLDPDG